MPCIQKRIPISLPDGLHNTNILHVQSVFLDILQTIVFCLKVRPYYICMQILLCFNLFMQLYNNVFLFQRNTVAVYSFKSLSTQVPWYCFNLATVNTKYLFVVFRLFFHKPQWIQVNTCSQYYGLFTPRGLSHA